MSERHLTMREVEVLDPPPHATRIASVHSTARTMAARRLRNFHPLPAITVPSGRMVVRNNPKLLAGFVDDGATVEIVTVVVAAAFPGVTGEGENEHVA